MESPSSSSVTVPGGSFVILSVSIVGILSIALLLLAYYLFLTRCGLLFFWRADQAIAVSVSVSVVQEPPRRSGGLEEAAIRRIPTFRYGGGQRLLPLPAAAANNGKPAAAATECAVCLADFRDGERLRLLPPCLHAFHIDCIDAWLHATATCPLCRAAVVVVDSQQQQQHVVGLPRATDDGIAIDIWPTDGAQQPAAAAPASPSSFLPVRRSLSMDSSTDKRFYLALQRLLHHSSSGSPAATATQGDAAAAGKVGAADSSSRRLRLSFFSFSQSRGESRSAVLPL